MNTIYQRMLLFDSQGLMIELRQIKGKLVTHQTKWISCFHKLRISSKMVARNNSGIKLNKPTNRYIMKQYFSISK